MSTSPASRNARGGGAVALGLCALLGIVVGLMAGLNIARRMVPAPTEARLTMQLLELEHSALQSGAATVKCPRVAAERMQLLFALVELIPTSLRDTLVVDAEFERHVQNLREGVRALAELPPADCRRRRTELERIDATCRDCHRAFRSAG